MQKAATDIENAANTCHTTTTTTTRTAAPPPRPAPDASRFKVRDYVLMGTASVLAGMGQLVVCSRWCIFCLSRATASAGR